MSYWLGAESEPDRIVAWVADDNQRGDFAGLLPIGIAAGLVVVGFAVACLVRWRSRRR